MKNWKGFFFVYTAIITLLFCSKIAEASSVSYNSILTEEADWIEIADFKELRSIMNGSIRPQTRHIRLTADITVSGGKDDIYYIISPEYAPIYIDTGEYTIYVEGQLQILGNALIFGKGGEEGLVHIRKGGYADIQGASLRAEEGYAVWQEDGAYFSASDWNESTSYPASYSCEGECRYPDKPVVWDSYEESSEEIPYRIVPAETAFTQEMLPEALFCVWCENGKRCEGKLPVFWETEENTHTSLQERKRTLLKGNFGMDRDAARRPECMLVFQNKNGAVIIKGELTAYTEDFFVMSLDFILDNYEEENDSFYVICSGDGKEWQRSEQGNYSLQNGIAYYDETFEDGRQPPVYFCVCVEKKDRLYYSDTVMISEDNTLVIADIQGGRGGGTPVLTGTGKLEPEQEVVSAAENSASEDVQTDAPAQKKEEGWEESAYSSAEQEKETVLQVGEPENGILDYTEEQNEQTGGKEADPEGTEAFPAEKPKTYTEEADFEKTGSETDMEAAEETEKVTDQGSEKGLEKGTAPRPAELPEDIRPGESFGQDSMERKRQIFMGFCSVGIILAAVFAGNAFFRSRGRK